MINYHSFNILDLGTAIFDEHLPVTVFENFIIYPADICMFKDMYKPYN